MIQDEKFFLVKSFNHRTVLLKWNKNLSIEIDESMDYKQYISLEINKLNQGDMYKPKSSKYEKVSQIAKETFLDYYNLAIRLIYNCDLTEGEYYFKDCSKGWKQINYYSPDGPDRFHLEIDLRDKLDTLWLRILKGSGFRGRPNTKKSFIPISKDEYQPYLNLTLEFLSDPESCIVFLKDYIKSFYNIAIKPNNIESLTVNPAYQITNTLEQLEHRKKYLEKRLIENDEDSAMIRAELRGEIKGIEYSINAFRTSRKMG